MTDDARLEPLLAELLDSDSTPEQVCTTCPDLLPQLHRRWRQMRRVLAAVDRLFPPASGLSARRTATLLPAVPGFRIDAELGRGGAGVVYKAHDLGLNRPVALKMLLSGPYAAPEERQRFVREAEAVARLRHPNIVQVYEAGDVDGLPYYTMELVEGGTLAQHTHGVPQPARAAAALVATLADAVNAAHQSGIVHRDLKPGNILLPSAVRGPLSVVKDNAAEGSLSLTTDHGSRTPDLIPKITDFGLAKQLEGGGALTLSGDVLGTPSYMAPEQARGDRDAVGRAVDVYALGAILYDCLTGRPPFRGETPAATLQHVLIDDVVPPVRLNPGVPRDLETICLTCLHKSPERRYPTAATLAEDLRRFQQGEPIAARRASPLERTLKWMRRRPAHAAALAVLLATLLILVCGGTWYIVHEARHRDALEAELKADLAEVTALQDSARWVEAQAALQRAKARLSAGAPDELHMRLEQARRDLKLVMRLDAIRLRRVTRGELDFYKAQANREYTEAFQQAGLGTIHDPPPRVAAQIEASAVRWALVAAVYDWAVCAGDNEQRRWLLQIARQTDPGAGDWHERALDPAAWANPRSLADLARTAPVADESVSLLLALGERLRAVHGDAAPYLRRVQREHPADFWANLITGNAHLQWAPKDALGYYRAVVASRPTAAVGYCAVGDALKLQDAPDQAMEHYEKALTVDPRYVRARNNVGDVLEEDGRFAEAIDSYSKAVQLDPDYAWPRYHLATHLHLRGQLDEARAQYEQVLRLDPDHAPAQNGIRSLLLQQGRGHEAQRRWRTALDKGPTAHDAWAGYAELCLFLGLHEEYLRTRRDLLDRFGATTMRYIAEPVARACLLVPGTTDEQQRAAALADRADRAVRAKRSTPAWVHSYSLFAKGLAEYRQGRLDSAIAIMNGEASNVMGAAPGLIRAMALHDQGQKEQARTTLAAAVVGFDWSAAQADSRDVWINHILRREAETKILPQLPAFLEGTHQPADNDERLALIAICQFQGRAQTVARLYADAFAVDPALEERLTAACRSRAALGGNQRTGRIEQLASTCRYSAARCAALAGCGRGADGAALSAAERTSWRKQARDWLRADLAMWAKTLDSRARTARVLVGKLLTQWQADPDLAGLREPSELVAVSPEERKDCLGLWVEIDGVLKRATGAR